MLSATLDDLYQRHLSQSERLNWSYHDLLPWELGQSYATKPWAEGQGTLSPEITLAVETALLTEVDLPWFTSGLTRGFEQAPDALKRFVKTWTAEEDQHARVLDVFLLLTRNGDPVRRSQLRRHVLAQGWELPTDDFLGIMVYTTIQELATRTFYQNLARVSASQDAHLGRVLRALARDETLHFAFYRDAVAAFLEDDPNRIEAVCRVVPAFSMPGAGMPDFAGRMRTVARHGAYGLPEYLDQVLKPLLLRWGIFEESESPAVADQRVSLGRYVERLERIARRTAEKTGSLTSAQ